MELVSDAGSYLASLAQSSRLAAFAAATSHVRVILKVVNGLGCKCTQLVLARMGAVWVTMLAWLGLRSGSLATDSSNPKMRTRRPGFGCRTLVAEDYPVKPWFGTKRSTFKPSCRG